MLGALLGTLLLGMQNLLTPSQVSSFWLQPTYGGIILIALIVARLTTGEAHE